MSGRRHPLNSFDVARDAREAARRAEAERVAQRRARDAALRVGQTFRDALRLGARVATGDQYELGGRASVRGVAESGEWGRVSIVERSEVGVCSAGAERDGVQLGERHRAEPGELLGVRKSVGRQADGAGGIIRSERLRAARCARERVGVGRGLLELQLCGAPADGTAWEQGNCASRIVRGGSWNDFRRNLRSALRIRNPTGNRNRTVGFRIARSLTT